MSIFAKTVECPKCRKGVSVEPEAELEHVFCPHCGKPLYIHVFPRLFAVPEVRQDSSPANMDQASCFFHSSRKAQAICPECGRFICSLCEVNLGNRRLCVTCTENNQRRQGAWMLSERRTIYDNIVMSLAVIPLLLWPVTIVTGPAAAFLAVWYWRKKQPLARGRAKLKLAIAGLLGLVQTIGWIVGGVHFLNG